MALDVVKSHLWSIILDGDLHVVIRVLLSCQTLKGGIHLDQELPGNIRSLI